MFILFCTWPNNQRKCNVIICSSWIQVCPTHKQTKQASPMLKYAFFIHPILFCK
jgi:hypothetical protein